MYWLLSILILTVMIAVLAIASSNTLPASLLSIEIASLSILPYLLGISLILIVISQRGVALAATILSDNSSTSDEQSTNKKLSAKKTSLIFSWLSQALYYLCIAALAILLVMASALQALSSHQRAENTKLALSMRVQALVTIEGISDSLYDPTSNSGYRQVATLSYVAPLIAELTAQELAIITAEQLQLNTSDNEGINRKFNDISITTSRAATYRVLLSAYPKTNTSSNNLATVNRLQPGDQLLMSLSLVPLATSEQALNNPTGFDSYRWLRGRHIDGVANIISVGVPINNLANSANTVNSSETATDSAAADNAIAPLTVLSNASLSFKHWRTKIDQQRWQLRQSFYQHWPSLSPAQQQANAVALSLLTGDRSLISRETKDLYQLAGISHLLAISGTHVLFLAIMLAGLVVLVSDRFCPILYSYLPRWQLRWGVMISAAFIYALFTGFDVPAARTAWMLLAVGLVRLSLVPVSAMRVLLALAVLLAWFDPYVLWQAGYWLSFVAVALILKYDNGLQQQHSDNSFKNSPQLLSKHQQNWRNNSLIYSILTKTWPLIKRLFKLQCWLFIALLPITLLLFGKASFWSLVINLFAISLFGWVIIPLNLLAGLCYLLWPSVASTIWLLVTTIMMNVHQLIAWLTSLPAVSSAWLYTPVNTAILLMGLLVLLPWLLPPKLLSRWLALPPLSLLIITLYANQQRLSSTPTLYVLPTNDSYLTAAVLQYPVNAIKMKDFNRDDKSAQQSSDSISWLILADHRPKTARTTVSMLTAEQLSATLTQQLGTLAIKRLEGIVVQTGSATPTAKQHYKQQSTLNIAYSPEGESLLALTARQLSQSLPTKHYWQAGEHKKLAAAKQRVITHDRLANKPISKSVSSNLVISAQHCGAGKVWQSANETLTIKAVTGWPMIADSSVWDCSLLIESDEPIDILQFNPANPVKSPVLTSQILRPAVSPATTSPLHKQAQPSKSRLILDVATHQRLWQLWQLMCTAGELDVDTDKPIKVIKDSDVQDQHNQHNYLSKHSSNWLTHSSSAVPSSVLIAQQVEQLLSYDNKPLAVAFAATANFDTDTDTVTDSNVDINSHNNTIK
ncbi:ComEC/Rec2 family competence protein [Psychrobacter sp. TAE2020]|uniref:ComEC/Rec2 family competence protein n=1 Tax=Psychrobacter sp. TAE2020 TaxID=2846762 RepID=UPI002B45DA89|nr:ComEC/Rec2 family competence protein [Psychrobacter sp. TAE2020]